MKPYYSDDLCTILHGDMRDLCASLRADAVITDAPFGIADDAVMLSEENLAKRRQMGRRGGNNTWHAPSEWDKAIDPAWCKIACEAAPLVAWFGFWKKRPEIEAAMPHPIRCEIVWAKDTHTSPPTPIAYRDERIWIFSRDAIQPQHFETTVWDEPIIPTWAHRRHKNEKPERLISRLVRWVAPSTWTILDPFMGSGTTLAVCKALGRKCIGIDLSEEHCETAARRLDKTRIAADAAGPLFASRAR